MSTQTAPDPAEALRARAEAASGLPDWGLVELLRDAVAVRRANDLLLARVAAHVASRSGPGGIAGKRGFRGVDAMIASETGGTVREAERLRVLGTALFGEPDDAPGGRTVLPHLAFAASEGLLSAEAFGLLRAALMGHPDARDMDGLPVDDAVRATPLGRVPIARLEKVSVDKAMTLPLRGVRMLVAQLEAGLTPAATGEEDYARLHVQRQAWFREERDGMVHLTAILDPLTAAPLMAAVDGYVKHAFRARREERADGDTRTPAQVRADALGWLGRHASGCRGPHDAVRTTVNVRIRLEDLRSGDGHGEIDGISRPVPVSVLRRHAADAEIIPTVLGGRSEVLDHGRAVRLFTPAQRRAIAERDRGCAHCGAPPSHCDVHHLEWWSKGGRTDLANGIMLCVACHHWVHRDGWGIRIHEGQPEFVPPAGIDPARVPRRGIRRAVTMETSELVGAGGGGPP